MASLYRQPLKESNINIEKNLSPLKKIEKIISPRSLKNDEIHRNESSNRTQGNRVLYFRELLTKNADELLIKCSIWEDLNLNIENQTLLLEIQGEIRTTIGQAKLVIKERFKQFKGLVDNCEFKTSEKEVTLQDLQGFWDMVYFQVEDVFKKFKDLEKRKEDNWINLPKQEVTKTKKTNKIVPLRTKSKSGPSQKQIEARKRLAAAKAAIKMASSSSSVISFDAVFFKVNSPVRAIKEKNQSPLNIERKRLLSSTPSSNFLHGRFLKKFASATPGDVVKSLNFDKNEPHVHSNDGVAQELQSEDTTHNVSENEELIAVNNKEENILNTLDIKIPSEENNANVVVKDGAPAIENNMFMTEIISSQCYNSCNGDVDNACSLQSNIDIINAEYGGSLNVLGSLGGKPGLNNEVHSKTIDDSVKSIDEMIASIGSLSLNTSSEKIVSKSFHGAKTSRENLSTGNAESETEIGIIDGEVIFSDTCASKETDPLICGGRNSDSDVLCNHNEIVLEGTSDLIEVTDFALLHQTRELLDLSENMSHIDTDINENNNCVEVNENLKLVTVENKTEALEKTNNMKSETKIKSVDAFTQTIGELNNEPVERESKPEKNLIDDLKNKITELEKQNDERRIYEENCKENGIDDTSDFYKRRYYILSDKVKYLEVELAPYRKLKEEINDCHKNLTNKFNLLKRKEKEAEACYYKLTKWAANLKLKSVMDSEELSKSRQLHANDLEEMNQLKEKILNYDELTKNVEKLTLSDEKLKNELKESEEKCELIRADRNLIRDNYNDQLKIVENLEATLENERFAIEELKILFQEQDEKVEGSKDLLAKSDNLIKDILKTNAQLEKEKQNNLQDVSSRDKTIQEMRQELASIQHELNITKTNARLSILEQQQEVVDSEVKLRDLHFQLTRFNQQLQAMGPNAPAEGQAIPNGYLETPAKSLVVSALRADANQKETPDNECNNEQDKPEVGLFSVVGLCTTLLDEVLDSAHQVDLKYKEKTTQLISDKNALMKKVQIFKDKLQEQEGQKNEVEIQLRIRLKEVIEQRDKRTEEIVARENVIKALSVKLQSQEG